MNSSRSLNEILPPAVCQTLEAIAVRARPESWHLVGRHAISVWARYVPSRDIDIAADEVDVLPPGSQDRFAFAHRHADYAAFVDKANGQKVDLYARHRAMRAQTAWMPLGRQGIEVPVITPDGQFVETLAWLRGRLESNRGFGSHLKFVEEARMLLPIINEVTVQRLWEERYADTTEPGAVWRWVVEQVAQRPEAPTSHLGHLLDLFAKRRTECDVSDSRFRLISNHRAAALMLWRSRFSNRALLEK